MRHLLSVVVCLCVGLIGIGCGGGSSCPDGDDEECTVTNTCLEERCQDGGVWCFDNCGNPDHVKQSCQGRGCTDGACNPSIDGDEPDGDIDFEITPPELPRLTDWECPDGWLSVPAFVDENGNEDVPEGMQQYHICEPPEYWNGPSGPVKLKSWECPPGWVPVVHETLTDENGLPFSWCEPPPLPEKCSEGFMPLLGSSECVHIGDPCPVGDFPDIPSEVPGRRIYIKAGSFGGNGTTDSPYGSINEALASAKGGEVLVIGPGRYVESLTPTVTVSFWGSCVERAIIEAPGPYKDGLAALATGAGVTIDIRNTRLTGKQIGIRVFEDGSKVIAEGVWVDQATRHGIAAEKGSVEITGSLISHTAGGPDGVGRGINFYGGSGSARDTSIISNQETGVVASGAATVVTLENIVISDTQTIAGGIDAGLFGEGLWIQQSARVTVNRGLIRRNRSAGIFATGSSTTAILSDVVVSDTQGVEGGPNVGMFGIGLLVEVGAQVTVERGLFERNRDVGISAFDEETNVFLLDVSVRDTQAVEGGEYTGSGGEGLWVHDAARVAVERGLFEQNREVGIRAQDEGSLVNLSDVIVRETREVTMGEYAGSGGYGLLVQGAAQLEIERGLFERNRETGVAIVSGAIATLEDVVSRATLPNVGTLSSGVAIEDAARVSIEKVVTQGNRDVGLYSYSTPDVSLADVVVCDTFDRRGGDTGDIGRGIEASDTIMTIIRGVIRRNRHLGLLVYGSTTLVNATDMVISDGIGVHGGIMVGGGVAVLDSCRLILTRGIIERNSAVGIFAVDPETKLELNDVVIQNQAPQNGGIYDGRFGRGVMIQTGAHAGIERAHITDNMDLGVFVYGRDASAILTDVLVTNTYPAPCSLYLDDDPNRCIEAGMNGIAPGIGVYLYSALSTNRFRISGNYVLGMQIAEHGRATLSNGIISNHQVGVNIQVPHYDITTLQDHVIFLNQKNLAYDHLPIPDPAGALPGIVSCRETQGRGCCTPDGLQAYTCLSESGSAIMHDCEASSLCGWTPFGYACGGDGTDPSGTYPYVCPGMEESSTKRFMEPQPLMPLPVMRPLPIRPLPRMRPIRPVELRSADAAVGQ